MDDVHVLDVAGPARGAWTSRHDGDARLDLHVLRTTPGTTLRSAHATAVMDTPDRSKYDYRALAWQRPSPGDSTTCVDLVFEPHIAGASLSRATGITADTEEAYGVVLETTAGEVSLYWSPGRTSEEITRFDDGTELAGALAVIADDRVTAVGSAGLTRAGRQSRLPAARQEGTVVALDRLRCTIDVEGLDDVSTGDRVIVNADGRGHTYLIMAVELVSAGVQRLTLDMASLHGRARIASTDGAHLELDFFLITRTATLHGTRLERESDGAWQPIVAAANHDAASTVVDLAAPLPEARAGDWVAAVDYVLGDSVRLEVQRSDATSKVR